MKTLYLLRHAKSSWANPNQPDFERPLNARGTRAALETGKLMRTRDFVPDLIIASPSVRTAHTAELVKDAAEFTTEICFEPSVYEASGGDLFAVLQAVENGCQKLLLVGHNPGSEDLLRDLTGETREMPTAALAEIELKIKDWNDVQPSRGTLENLFLPREL